MTEVRNASGEEVGGRMSRYSSQSKGFDCRPPLATQLKGLMGKVTHRENLKHSKKAKRSELKEKGRDPHSTGDS